jgi:hypothetical protein
MDIYSTMPRSLEKHAGERTSHIHSMSLFTCLHLLPVNTTSAGTHMNLQPITLVTRILQDIKHQIDSHPTPPVYDTQYFHTYSTCTSDLFAKVPF